jgi:hypothetical protein
MAHHRAQWKTLGIFGQGAMAIQALRPDQNIPMRSLAM